MTSEREGLVPSIDEFRAIILDHFRQFGRRFPWRDTLDPWHILVSEVMLQQTQTERVIGYWLAWIERWPRPEDLAAASLDEALRAWSGLGYNRRGRFLRDAAVEITNRFGGRVPAEVPALESLPGIGPYTARAVATFAFGAREIFIETNIRSVVLHFFFPGEDRVPDSVLYPLLEAAMDRNDPRRWYWALMDYGAALKKTAANPNRRSKHYARQSRFEGSLRQARGAVLRALLDERVGSVESLSVRLALEPARVQEALRALGADGLVAETSGEYRVL